MAKYQLTYKPLGDSAVLIEWPQKISTKILHDIRYFAVEIEKNNYEGILEVSFVYASLLICYDNFKLSFEKIINLLASLYESASFSSQMPKNTWMIPVCYEDRFGVDLSYLAIHKKVTVEEIISLHTAPFYTVYGIGFLPGFLYLGGLSKNLHFPRRDTPRLAVPKGAVAIGGSQTGIYPQNSPGGWHIIGKTPISLFDVNKDIPCQIVPGDEIKFNQISMEEFDKLKEAQKSGAYELKNITND